MKKESKDCVIILPYFGKFNNYFSLFLKSCSYNPKVQWIIFTDDKTNYNYPENVKVIFFTLKKIKELAEIKMNIKVSLEFPYKLCDYKPAYGLIFDDYIKEYKYWGHCDCDVIFGDIQSLLFPILSKSYDKIFAVGHLTLYRNTYENNTLFMNKYKNRSLYKEAFQNEEIYVFDEDFENWRNPNCINVHNIFLEKEKKVFVKDLSFNVSTESGKIKRTFYDSETRKFKIEKYVPRRYYWFNGHIYSIEYQKDADKIFIKEYLYIHLQMRKMRMKKDVLENNCIEILPDRFITQSCLPNNKKQMRNYSIRFSYMYWIDTYISKIKRKLYI